MPGYIAPRGDGKPRPRKSVTLKDLKVRPGSKGPVKPANKLGRMAPPKPKVRSTASQRGNGMGR